MVRDFFISRAKAKKFTHHVFPNCKHENSGT
ncbi:DUF1661 domain-containing protein [Porphyromonas gingivalis]|nr:DUF1661 domain-containing protein [Porphyromonas gingivalis]